jgi:hypothetical protein
MFPPAAQWTRPVTGPGADTLPEVQVFNFNLVLGLDNDCRPVIPRRFTMIDYVSGLIPRFHTRSPNVDLRIGVGLGALKEPCAMLQLVVGVMGFQYFKADQYSTKNNNEFGTIGPLEGWQWFPELIKLSNPIGVFVDKYIFVNPSSCSCLPDCLPCFEQLTIGGVDTWTVIGRRSKEQLDMDWKEAPQYIPPR